MINVRSGNEARVKMKIGLFSLALTQSTCPVFLIFHIPVFEHGVLFLAMTRPLYIYSLSSSICAATEVVTSALEPDSRGILKVIKDGM